MVKYYVYLFATVDKVYTHMYKNIACRLKKTLYELKQSSKAWFERFCMAIKQYGFGQSNYDHILFLKYRKSNCPYNFVLMIWLWLRMIKKEKRDFRSIWLLNLRWKISNLKYLFILLHVQVEAYFSHKGIMFLICWLKLVC